MQKSQLIRKWTRRGLTSFGLLLVLVTCGCATSRPSRVVIEPGEGNTTAGSFERPQTLKIVSYNVWGLPSWLTGAKAKRYPTIAHELERLDPDIILLQETWTAKARRSAPVGNWSKARAAGQHTLFGQSGLVTLSKFPIVGGEFYPFSREAFPDKLVTKGVLKVTVRLPDGHLLNVWNTHLQSGRSVKVRRAQARELIQLVEAEEDGQIADVIGGDFNCTPASELFAELTSMLVPDATPELIGAGSFVTWRKPTARGVQTKTIDYIFVRNCSPSHILRADYCPVLAPERSELQLSDHIGIQALVTIRTDTPAAALFANARSANQNTSVAP